MRRIHGLGTETPIPTLLVSSGWGDIGASICCFQTCFHLFQGEYVQRASGAEVLMS